MTERRRRLAVLGAGPVGLDAALAAAGRGWDLTLYEAGERPAACVRAWGHVRLFSPWSMNASARMRQALEAAGARVPDGEDHPTGHELCDRVLDPVAALPAVEPALRLGHRVEAVGREGLLKNEEIGGADRTGRAFRMLVRGPEGTERVEHADAVLDCTGTYTHPNALGDGGIPAPGETALGDQIVRRIPDVAADPKPWAGKTIFLVGAGHSAQTAARDLARLAESERGTRVVWALRTREPAWVIEDDPLPARAVLAEEAERLARGGHGAIEPRLGVVVEELGELRDRVRVTLRTADGGRDEVDVDRVLALTGSVGDDRLYRQLQVHECYATGAPMKLSAALLGAGGGGDCLAQTGFGPETLTNPEPRFFILGAKSYGRNSAFLMRTGWEQVDDAFGLLEEAFGREVAR